MRFFVKGNSDDPIEKIASMKNIGCDLKKLQMIGGLLRFLILGISYRGVNQARPICRVL